MESYILRLRSRTGYTKITKEELKEKLNEFNSQWKVADYFGVSQMSISRAKRKLNITHDGKIKANRDNEKIESQKKAINKWLSENIHPNTGRKHSKEEIEKRASKQRGKPAWNSGTKKEKCSCCEICFIFYYHPPHRNRRFCSRECSAIHFKEIYSDGRYIGDKNPNFENDKVKEAWKNGSYDKREISEYTRGKRTMYNGINFRSTWEAEYAEYLDLNGIKWEYENKKFDLLDGRTYTPDFYIPSIDCFIEVKGYWWPVAIEKFSLFKKIYSDIKIIIEDDNKKWKIK